MRRILVLKIGSVKIAPLAGSGASVGFTLPKVVSGGCVPLGGGIGVGSGGVGCVAAVVANVLSALTPSLPAASLLRTRKW